MNYDVVRDVLSLIEQFDIENHMRQTYTPDVTGFKQWLVSKELPVTNDLEDQLHWEGKLSGRSPESVISTLLVHLNRYAKMYAKSAIADSNFRTQEEFIYLINLRYSDSMTKMELIKKNVQDKSAGILVINRLISQGWVEQIVSEKDKRSKVLKITDEGIEALDNQMDKIRTATSIVSGNLNVNEKLQLIQLLDKLEHFHQPIFNRNIDPANLLETVIKDYSIGQKYEK